VRWPLKLEVECFVGRLLTCGEAPSPGQIAGDEFRRFRALRTPPSMLP
jgi:hypothetical protein